MKAGLEVWRCNGCGKTMFPERIFCPACHGAEFSRDTVLSARVEEISLIHHMIGQENWQKRRIANVMTDAGFPLTAGLLDEADIGDEVELCEQDQAAFARKKSG